MVCVQEHERWTSALSLARGRAPREDWPALDRYMRQAGNILAQREQVQAPLALLCSCPHT
jgi:hypothetical protein